MHAISSSGSAHWYLKGCLSDGSPWIIPITSERFTIGRSVKSSLILDAPDVSRQHTSLFTDGGDAFVADLDSRNGTFLNGSRVEMRRQLQDGDILKVGRFEFMVSRGADAPDSDHTVVEAGDHHDFAEKIGLSPREREVLYLLVRGDAVKEIARKLFISPGTAKNHVLKIYAKSGCHTRIELVNRYNGYNGAS